MFIGLVVTLFPCFGGADHSIQIQFWSSNTQVFTKLWGQTAELQTTEFRASAV